MNPRKMKRFGILIFFLMLFGMSPLIAAQKPTNGDGSLEVEVTWGDINPTPAENVYVEAYGYAGVFDSPKSFVLKKIRVGQYGISLPHGVYDVLVSEAGSVPRCRRVLIREGLTTYWTLKLEIDDVYLNK